MFNIELYEDINGKSELNDYIENLQKSKNKDDRIKSKKIDMYFRLLEEYGLSLSEPYIKHIDDEIWALRPLRDRFLFAYWTGNKFIILNHFMKQRNRKSKKIIRRL